MEQFFLIDAWGKEQRLVCDNWNEAIQYVNDFYANTGKRTILRKTYEIVSTETININTNYSEDD